MALSWLVAGFSLAAALATPFARLQTLAGNWEARTESGAIIRVSFRTIANQSALLQTYTTPSGKETVTVFHPDGKRLLATHYCAQGNQPRLQLEDASADRLVFHILDATNLPSKDTSHLIMLELRFDAPDQYTSVETYFENGKLDVTTLHFRRRP